MAKMHAIYIEVNCLHHWPMYICNSHRMPCHKNYSAHGTYCASKREKQSFDERPQLRYIIQIFACRMYGTLEISTRVVWRVKSGSADYVGCVGFNSKCLQCFVFNNITMHILTAWNVRKVLCRRNRDSSKKIAPEYEQYFNAIKIIHHENNNQFKLQHCCWFWWNIFTNRLLLFTFLAIFSLFIFQSFRAVLVFQ